MKTITPQKNQSIGGKSQEVDYTGIYLLKDISISILDFIKIGY